MAYKKVCPECGKKSHSASNSTIWNCPYCGKDLSDVKTE